MKVHTEEGFRPGAPEAGGPPSDAAIYGLDNVRLELPLAGIGSRTLAATLDHCLLAMLQMVWLFGGTVFFGIVGLGGWGIGLLIAGFFLLQWGYFAGFEIAIDGQTPGKLAVGLRVVSHRGGRTTAGALLVRNFLRSFDYFVGLPLMAVDRHARRFGDLVAGTLVVHHRRAPDGEVALGRHPASWGAREIAVVESFLRRAPAMEARRAERLADRLLSWIERREPDFWATVEPPATRDTATRDTATRGTANRGTANRGTANRGTANRGTANRVAALRQVLEVTAG